MEKENPGTLELGNAESASRASQAPASTVLCFLFQDGHATPGASRFISGGGFLSLSYFEVSGVTPVSLEYGSGRCFLREFARRRSSARVTAKGVALAIISAR